MYREKMPDGTTRLTGETISDRVRDDTDWIALPLVGGWVDFGAPFEVARYCRYQGFVYIEGLIKRTGALVPPLTAFANLPDGFRPRANKVLPTIIYPGTGTESWGGIYVTSAGDLAVSTGNIDVNGYVHINLTPFAAA